MAHTTEKMKTYRYILSQNFLPSSLFKRKDKANIIKYNNWMRTYNSGYGTATYIVRSLSDGANSVPTIYRKTESGDTYIKISKYGTTNNSFWRIFFKLIQTM